MNTAAIQFIVNDSLTLTERIIRMAIGVACIGSIFVTGSNVLSGQTLFCLFGIYPMVCGVTGISLLRGSMHRYAALIRNVCLARATQLFGKRMSMATRVDASVD